MAGQRVLVPYIGVRVLSPELASLVRSTLVRANDERRATMNKTIDKVTTKRMALYTGRTHPALAERVAKHLEVQLGEANIIEFANGELRPQFGESIRGGDVVESMVAASMTRSWNS